MASYLKKAPTKTPAPRAKPSGAGKFPHVSAPKMPALKSRVYTKSALREDPTKFGDFGFGDTGLDETPQVENMGYKK